MEKEILKDVELVITRVFSAPRELVWRFWTNPDLMMKWWGPEVFTAPFCKIDLRVGGEYLYCMRSPEGQDFWSKGVYREIVEPERLVMTDSFADEKGNTVPASYYNMPGNWPLELSLTVIFEEFEGKTKFTLRHIGMPEVMIKLAEIGWKESFDKLADALKTHKEK